MSDEQPENDAASGDNEKPPITFETHLNYTRVDERLTREGVRIIDHVDFKSEYKSLMEETINADNNYRDIVAENIREGVTELSEVQKKGLQALQEQKRIADFFTENLVESAKRGVTFPTGRRKGAISDRVKYITDLANKTPDKKALALFIDADKKIIGDMTERTFANHVSNARKPKQ